MSCSDLNVTLVSSDGVAFSVPSKVANLSIFVSMMTDEYDASDYEFESIPVMLVPSNVLSMIIEFMHYYHTDPMITIEKPLISNHIGDVVQPWYAIFIERVKHENMLYDIVNAANYMYIQSLLDLSCAAVATLIHEKSVSDVMNELYITA
jgi:S-phase kinase-associated protein 1